MRPSARTTRAILDGKLRYKFYLYSSQIWQNSCSVIVPNSCSLAGRLFRSRRLFSITFNCGEYESQSGRRATPFSWWNSIVLVDRWTGAPFCWKSSSLLIMGSMLRSRLVCSSPHPRAPDGPQTIYEVPIFLTVPTVYLGANPCLSPTSLQNEVLTPQIQLYLAFVWNIDLLSFHSWTFQFILAPCPSTF